MVKRNFKTMNKPRYSEKAIKEMRHKNLLRFLDKLDDFKKDNYDYSDLEKNFKTQKNPKVKIVCKIHKNSYFISPHDFLRYRGGGCKQCALEINANNYTQVYKKRFMDWFNKNLSHKVELIDEIKEMRRYVTIQCKVHPNAKKRKVIPYQLRNLSTTYCDECLKESISQSTSLDKFEREKIKNYYEKFKHIKLLSLKTKLGTGTEIKIKCKYHGELNMPLRYFRNDNQHFGCKDCGERFLSFDGKRISNLLESKTDNETVNFGCLKLEVFEQETLKIGISKNKLQSRYSRNLKEILFQDSLDNLSALLFENEIKRKFLSFSDKKLIDTGKKMKNRFQGDTECFEINKQKKIIEWIQKRIKDYKNKNVNLEEKWKYYKVFRYEN